MQRTAPEHRAHQRWAGGWRAAGFPIAEDGQVTCTVRSIRDQLRGREAGLIILCRGLAGSSRVGLALIFAEENWRIVQYYAPCCTAAMCGHRTVASHAMSAWIKSRTLLWYLLQWEHISKLACSLLCESPAARPRVCHHIPADSVRVATRARIM